MGRFESLFCRVRKKRLCKAAERPRVHNSGLGPLTRRPRVGGSPVCRKKRRTCFSEQHPSLNGVHSKSPQNSCTSSQGRAGGHHVVDQDHGNATVQTYSAGQPALGVPRPGREDAITDGCSGFPIGTDLRRTPTRREPGSDPTADFGGHSLGDDPRVIDTSMHPSPPRHWYWYHHGKCVRILEPGRRGAQLQPQATAETMQNLGTDRVFSRRDQRCERTVVATDGRESLQPVGMRESGIDFRNSRTLAGGRHRLHRLDQSLFGIASPRRRCSQHVVQNVVQDRSRPA